ncbi:uncharacterized protein LOC114870856 isoform X2 [Osmia bicornis bicornis]|uniref:uncharacterized protein LOC114870856 isoform X2 n=1 Tax=Osmia bicornis bicornis TaxID=1437191 RepID=UPI0010F5E218|nr:uncharacterized protein LOC114870856 isoform X2 [Osmia bicornis bicornis]
MLGFDNLEKAVVSLSKSISNFPIGAVSLNDFKPIEERIRETRKTLKALNARLLMLKAQRTATEESEGDIVDTITELNDATSYVFLNSMKTKLCFHSFTIQDILAGKQGDPDMQEKIYACMHKIFSINDISLSLLKDIDEARNKQFDLKVKCRYVLIKYKMFLKEQEEICNKKLQETNPHMALNKAKTMKALKNINVMKKLIVDFIGAAYHMLYDHIFLVKMLEKHRELINIDTILTMAEKNIEPESTAIED